MNKEVCDGTGLRLFYLVELGLKEIEISVTSTVPGFGAYCDEPSQSSAPQYQRVAAHSSRTSC
jgi:hypothetical protein